MTIHRFDDKVAVITGGGSGLGYQHAITLARLGCKVLIQDLRAEHGASPEEKTAKEVTEYLATEGIVDTAYDQGSVGDENYCIRLIEHAVERFGRIDILINNAGMPSPGTAQNTETTTLFESLNVNLLGAFWTMRTALNFMRNQNYGRIVNTASATAVFGSPDMLSYVTAKGGMLAMTRSASLDNLDRNIKINSLCPVAYTVMGREYFGSRKHVDLAALDPAYVTPVALYLSHDKCAFTGETLSAGAGKWSRLFSAKADGPNTISKNLDDVFSSIDLIMDYRRFQLLHSAQDQYD